MEWRLRRRINGCIIVEMPLSYNFHDVFSFCDCSHSAPGTLRHSFKLGFDTLWILPPRRTLTHHTTVVAIFRFHMKNSLFLLEEIHNIVTVRQVIPCCMLCLRWARILLPSAMMSRSQERNEKYDNALHSHVSDWSYVSFAFQHDKPDSQ